MQSSSTTIWTPTKPKLTDLLQFIEVRCDMKILLINDKLGGEIHIQEKKEEI